MNRDKFAADRTKVFQLNEVVDYFNYSSKTWIIAHGKVVGNATVIVDGEIRNLVMVKVGTPLADTHGSTDLVAIHPDSLRIQDYDDDPY